MSDVQQRVQHEGKHEATHANPSSARLPARFPFQHPKHGRRRGRPNASGGARETSHALPDHAPQVALRPLIVGSEVFAKYRCSSSNNHSDNDDDDDEIVIMSSIKLAANKFSLAQCPQIWMLQSIASAR